MRIVPAIMSGGAGTRLWPLSTEAHPKQFHTLGWDRTLFAQTLARVSGPAFAPPLVLCNARHETLVREHLTGSAHTVLEPAPRNTAAVAAIAAALAHEIEPGALVLLTPSDHVIQNEAAFHRVIAGAAACAREHIVTFGVEPTRAATGYGYIKSGARLGDGIFAIDSFKEKPDVATAQHYLSAGGYLWNAGIFLFSPAVMLREFEASADIRDAALAALHNSEREGERIALNEDQFAKVRSAPLDIAVMEKTGFGAVACCDIGWADIGTWDEVWRLAPRDSQGLAVLGAAAAADVSKIQASGVKAVAIDGDDLVVAATRDGIAVLPRDQAHNAAKLLA